MRLPILLATLTSVIFGAPAPADANPRHAAPGDRAAVEACLELVRENVEREAQKPVENEAPGPAGRLAGAAKEAATSYEKLRWSSHNPVPAGARWILDAGHDRMQ
jgi:hypothetical protein